MRKIGFLLNGIVLSNRCRLPALIGSLLVAFTSQAQCIGCTNTLPLHHLDLSANLQGGKVYLKWLAENESNTRNFLVQRSADGINYVSVDTVVVGGPSNMPTTYQVTDSIQTGSQDDVIFYRVLAEDNLSRYGYSNIIYLHLDKKITTQVWPNPFVSAVNITYKALGNTTVDISLMDNAGRVLQQMHAKAYNGINQFSITSLGGLPGGMYIISITDKNSAKTYMEKLMK